MSKTYFDAIDIKRQIKPFNPYYGLAPVLLMTLAACSDNGQNIATDILGSTRIPTSFLPEGSGTESVGTTPTRGITYNGGAGADMIVGTDHIDLLRGGSGADIIDGGTGNDAIIVVGAANYETTYSPSGFRLSTVDYPRINGVGIPIAHIVSRDDFNQNIPETTDADTGDMIDGGMGRDLIVVYGTATLDFSNIQNIETIAVKGILTILNSQSIPAGFEISSSIGSVIKLEGNGVLPFENFAFSGRDPTTDRSGRIEIGTGLTLSANEALANQQPSIFAGNGTLEIRESLAGIRISDDVTLTTNSGGAIYYEASSSPSSLSIVVASSLTPPPPPPSSSITDVVLRAVPGNGAEQLLSDLIAPSRQYQFLVIDAGVTLTADSTAFAGIVPEGTIFSISGDGTLAFSRIEGMLSNVQIADSLTIGVPRVAGNQIAGANIVASSSITAPDTNATGVLHANIINGTTQSLETIRAAETTYTLIMIDDGVTLTANPTVLALIAPSMGNLTIIGGGTLRLTVAVETLSNALIADSLTISGDFADLDALIARGAKSIEIINGETVLSTTHTGIDRTIEISAANPSIEVTRRDDIIRINDDTNDTMPLKIDLGGGEDTVILNNADNLIDNAITIAQSNTSLIITIDGNRTATASRARDNAADATPAVIIDLDGTPNTTNDIITLTGVNWPTITRNLSGTNVSFEGRNDPPLIDFDRPFIATKDTRPNLDIATPYDPENQPLIITIIERPVLGDIELDSQIIQLNQTLQINDLARLIYNADADPGDGVQDTLNALELLSIAAARANNFDGSGFAGNFAYTVNDGVNPAVTHRISLHVVLPAVSTTTSPNINAGEYPDATIIFVATDDDIPFNLDLL